MNYWRNKKVSYMYVFWELELPACCIACPASAPPPHSHRPLPFRTPSSWARSPRRRSGSRETKGSNGRGRTGRKRTEKKKPKDFFYKNPTLLSIGVCTVSVTVAQALFKDFFCTTFITKGLQRLFRLDRRIKLGKINMFRYFVESWDREKDAFPPVPFFRFREGKSKKRRRTKANTRINLSLSLLSLLPLFPLLRPFSLFP